MCWNITLKTHLPTQTISTDLSLKTDQVFPNSALFNKIWTWNSFPNSWRIAIIINYLLIYTFCESDKHKADLVCARATTLSLNYINLKLYPQGSVIGPHWNTNCSLVGIFLKSFRKWYKHFTSGKRNEIFWINLQKTLNPSQKWADLNELTFSEKKTHRILFINKQKIE